MYACHFAGAEPDDLVVVRVVQCAAGLVVQAGQRRDGALVFGQQRLREIRVVQFLVGELLDQRPDLVVQGAGGDMVAGGRFGLRQHLEHGFLDGPTVFAVSPVGFIAGTLPGPCGFAGVLAPLLGFPPQCRGGPASAFAAACGDG